jgi:hypothetical protein
MLKSGPRIVIGGVFLWNEILWNEILWNEILWNEILWNEILGYLKFEY